MTCQTYEDGDKVTYQYDNDGALASMTDSATGRTTRYYYDFTGRVTKYTETGTGYNHSVEYRYDTSNNLTAQTEIINGVTHTTSYTYDTDNRVTSKTTDGITVQYTYDTLGRITKQVTKNGNTTVKTETYTFTPNSSQIATYRTQMGSYDVTYTYTYDNNGNILTVNDGTSTTSYAYDSQNQLIRENNQSNGFTHTWTYDSAGNILSAQSYDYSTGALGAHRNTANYAYGESNWRDLLTEFNGQAITYDGIGNPTSYRGNTLTWEHGRKLTSLSNGTTTWTYTYDADGMRTQRTNGNTTYNYVYNGSQLVQMTANGHTLNFTYDANGTPLSVTMDGTVYYYITNIQGDVTGIRNTNGSTELVYRYDAWGRLLYTNNDNSPIALNPLRYRGYVYDAETGFYYVSSRYYDPEIGRWISPEPNVDYGEFDEGAGLLGYNVYAYCANNPVMFKDETGESITLACVLIFGGVGLLAGGHFAAKASKAKLGYVNGWWVLGGMVVGGGVGALLGWSVGSAATAIGAKLAAGSSGTLGKVIYSSWQSAEKALRTAYKGAKATFNTPWGKRVIDSYSKNVIREAKYGYQGLSKFIQQEINKDVWILKNTSVKSIEWHFYWSSVSNSGGPSGPLLKELARYGIKVIFH